MADFAYEEHEAKLEEILKEMVIQPDAGFVEDDYGSENCIYCGNMHHWDALNYKRTYPHSDTCPIARGRRELGLKL